MSSTKIFTSHWNYVLDVVILPKFGNSSISVRLIKTSILEKPIFYVFSWFNFNNSGPALDNALTFYISVAKGSKLKVKVLGATSYDSRSYRRKMVEGFFSPSPSWMVKLWNYFLKKWLQCKHSKKEKKQQLKKN